jgi:hypothetical protein
MRVLEMRHVVLAACFAMTMMVCLGCRDLRSVPAAKPNDTGPDQTCPQQLQGQIRLIASAIPRTVPADLAVDPDALNEVRGSRILLSVAPADVARGMRVISSTLTVTTFGGTFKGWALIGNGAEKRGALDIIPGRLRLTPFLSKSKLEAQSMSLDVWVAPGAAPIDEMALSAVSLWDADRHPIAPEALQVSLLPLRHFTTYDLVEATINLDFVVQQGRASWQCSVQRHITLVDHDSAAPPLWDLRKAPEKTAVSELWLALFGPKSGPSRAIFTSPAEANGFAAWLRETHATRVGPYQLGLFRPDYSEDSRHAMQPEHSLTDTYHAASADDLNGLIAGRLGEP